MACVGAALLRITDDEVACVEASLVKIADDEVA